MAATARRDDSARPRPSGRSDAASAVYRGPVPGRARRGWACRVRPVVRRTRPAGRGRRRCGGGRMSGGCPDRDRRGAGCPRGRSDPAGLRAGRLGSSGMPRSAGRSTTRGMLAEALGHGRGGTRLDEAIVGLRGDSLGPRRCPSASTTTAPRCPQSSPRSASLGARPLDRRQGPAAARHLRRHAGPRRRDGRHDRRRGPHRRRPRRPGDAGDHPGRGRTPSPRCPPPSDADVARAIRQARRCSADQAQGGIPLHGPSRRG